MFYDPGRVIAQPERAVGSVERQAVDEAGWRVVAGVTRGEGKCEHGRHRARREIDLVDSAAAVVSAAPQDAAGGGGLPRERPVPDRLSVRANGSQRRNRVAGRVSDVDVG